MLNRFTCFVSIVFAVLMVEIPPRLINTNQALPVDKGLFSASVNAAEVMAATPDNLEATAWVLTESDSIKPVNGTIAKIRFQGGRVSGSTGCNNFNGSYTVTGNRLTIAEAIATTRKACPGELATQEQTLLQLLPQLSQFRVNDQGYLEMSDGDKTATLVFIPEAQVTPLHNSQWRLVKMAGNVPLTESHTTPMVQFMGNRIAGTGGCNRFTGRFTVEGDRLQVDERLASTMMACPDPQMQQEQAFTQALAAATIFTIQGNQLTINYTQAGKTQQLQFEADRETNQRTDKVMDPVPSAPTRALW
ncbi:MAG: META domain-containing protein [Synechocystis sp.]|nr:META domain-containing protein [Synechocystis sp.]